MPSVKEAAPMVGMGLGILAVAIKNHLLPTIGDFIDDLPRITPSLVGAGLMYFGFVQLLKK